MKPGHDNPNVVVPYSSSFLEREADEDKFEVIIIEDLLQQTLPPSTECPRSAIYFLRHLFGPGNALIFEVDGDAPQRTFKLDGSEEIWQIEHDLDIAERDGYQWGPKEAVALAAVGVKPDPSLNFYEEQRRIDQIIIELTESTRPPSAIIQHGPQVQLIWKLAGKATRRQLDGFENRFHSKFDTVPSDQSLFQITPGLLGVHMHQPHTVYLSEAVYRPGDLGKMYATAAVPAVSKPKAAPPAWRQRIEKAYDLLPPTGMFNAVGHILAHERELQVNVDPVFSVAWHRYPKDGGEPGLYYSPTGSVEGEESPSGSAVTVLNKPILSMAFRRMKPARISSTRRLMMSEICTAPCQGRRTNGCTGS